MARTPRRVRSTDEDPVNDTISLATWLRPWFDAAFGRSGWLRPSPAFDTPDEAPLRAELFTAEQLEQQGKRVAAAHELTDRPFADRLLPRLAANEKTLV